MSALIPAILCGGAGSRLWPLSRARKPKQLHPLVSERSLLAETIARALTLPGVTPADVMLIAGERFADDIRAEAAAGGAPEALIIIEPEGRNTAPAAALAALAARARDPEAVVLLTPSDHHIGDIAAFARAAEAGAALARENYIVTFGITPDGPHTGYGYIKRGAPLTHGFKVDRFDEKPDLETAKRFFAEGGRDWNSGLYLYKPDAFLAELETFEPGVRAAAEAALAGGRMEGGLQKLDADAWRQAKSISIDHAVAERTARAAVIPASMQWSDIGSFAALWEIAEKDEAGNALRGDVRALGAANCYARANGRMIALIGLEDMIVIDTPDALLIAPRARAEDVKKMVEQLAKDGRKDLL